MRRGTPSSLPLNAVAGPSIAANAGNAAKSNSGPKWTGSLEEWEKTTPLSDMQLRSVQMVAKLVENHKDGIPLKFADESPPATPSTGDDTPTKHHSSNPPTSSVPRPNSQPSLHPSYSIQTPQQFYDWYGMIERSVAHSQEASYRAHLASLDEHLTVCDLVVNRIEEVEQEVDGMMQAWRSVEDGGRSLQGACERLLEERDGLVSMVEDIGTHLEYFQELEHATRMLNHPGESLVFDPNFLYMVARVDICIDFLKNHRHYKEAEVYLLRFHQCMTRAMTLIKMNFVSSLRTLSAEVSKRLAEKDISSTTSYHLLYTRFRTLSQPIRPLLSELAMRANRYPSLLSSLLTECHYALISTRKTLISPRVIEEIRGMDPDRKELVELAREGCGYLRELCRDEWGIWDAFFDGNEDEAEAEVHQYLETLCDILYDDLRPRILHEPRLTVLCEVCTVLQALMVLDATVESSSSGGIASGLEENGEENENTNGKEDDILIRNPLLASANMLKEKDTKSSKKMKRGKNKLHISHLLNMVLQDAQTRLFFKAQAVIQSDIRFYVPKGPSGSGGAGEAQQAQGGGGGNWEGGDLDWPGVLLASSKSSNNNTELREKEMTSQIFRTLQEPGQEGQKKEGRWLAKEDTWYPTLRKTVWVLGQLHDFVKPAIFNDIAREAISYCRASLVNASELITASQSKWDGSLFLVRHLLVLKEVVRSLEERGQNGFQGMESAKDGMKSAGLASVASNGIGDTLAGLLNKTTFLLPESLFATLGVARGGDMSGVKLDMDHSLRQSCEEVIAACAEPVCAPLEKWLESASSEPTPMEEIDRELRIGVGKIRLYVDDERTARVLLEHVVGRVCETYERVVGSIDADVRDRLEAVIR